MRLALALADELAQEMPVAAAANELYKRARRDGCDDEDFSAVMKAVKKM
jgi:glyoxylate/succinic semialdehyde reductase